MSTVSFELAGMYFEYDEEKNQKNIRKHGIDFRSAARVFFDYDRIELVDEEHSDVEERYNTIGDTSAANVFERTIIGTIKTQLPARPSPQARPASLTHRYECETGRLGSRPLHHRILHLSPAGGEPFCHYGRLP